jgi:hypothetical protein
MVSSYLKKTVVFSVVSASIIAAGITGFFSACENPFSNNLGGKVDVEPPTVTDVTPISGFLLQGVQRFQGNASAYRELRDVEVKILDFDESNSPILDWTNVGIQWKGENDTVKNKEWYYDLDTKNFFGPGRPLPDGFLKIRFRARDKSLSTETVDMVYIVKNNPSTIKLTAPSDADLHDRKLPMLLTDGELFGQIIDRRGIKPGYPRIKMWPENMDEPAGDDPDWGWAQLFLSGIDDLETGYYADRTQLPVVRVAEFKLRLSKFTIDTNTRHIIYDRSGGGGSFVPLPLQVYNFRIQTSDTFFYNDPNDADQERRAKYLLPRARDPEIEDDDDGELIGYYPADTISPDPLNKGLYYSVNVDEEGVVPEIELDNDDKSVTELESVPNIYVTEPTAMKTFKEGQPIFRLRIRAAHLSEEIRDATLTWRHPSSRRQGTLTWDNDPAGTGTWKNDSNHLEGKNFVFTGIGNSIYTYTDAGGASVMGPVFTNSSDPYILTVMAYSASGSSSPPTEYTVYMDGSTPNVSIRSVMGAYAEPQGNAYADTDKSGGRINEYSYTVNGNIQVSIERSSSMGLASAKWIVEEDILDYLANTGTVLQKLRNYFDDPTAVNFEFYKNLDTGTAKTEGRAGDIKEGTTNPLETFPHLKFNTVKGSLASNGWNKKSLWLYVIVEDKVQNLGFILQKIYVDDDTDIPQLTVPRLTDEIKSVADLSYANNPSRRNMLGNSEGIDLTVTDDDGILLPGGVTVRLRDLNSTPQREVPITVNRTVMTGGSDTYPSVPNSSTEWNGSLSQEIMAAALYAGQSSAPTRLNDGFYSVAITVQDNLAVKVKIDGSRPGDQPTSRPADPATQTFYFAVRSQEPIVRITAPSDGDTQNNVPVTITGTVQSPFPLTSLKITFTPNVAGGDSGPKDVTIPAVGSNNVYSWTYGPVNFASVSAASGERRIEIAAVDGMGYSNTHEIRVEVDNGPPQIRLTSFNFGRLPQLEDGVPRYVVNGKVPLTINVMDPSGIKTTGTNTHIGWWILSSKATPPTWANAWTNPANAPTLPAGTNGICGRFLVSDAVGNDYSRVINTNGLTDNTTYYLYAIAEDATGNRGEAVELQEFYVKQSSDIPVLDENGLKPLGGLPQNTNINPLRITGTVTDDDGFDELKYNSAAYVQIRFPTTNSSTVPPATGDTGWGNWITIPVTKGGGAEEIEFAYAPPTGSGYPNTHLAGNGNKYYQIRITDEAAAGADNNPPGKNPAGTVVPTNATLSAVTQRFPATGFYSFSVKTTPPEVHFSKYPSTSSERPIYRTFSAMVTDLRDGWVSDLYLDPESLEIHYTSNATSGFTAEARKLSYTTPVTNNEYKWIINTTPANGNIEGYLSPLFAAGNNGMHTITIIAADTVGGTTRAEWSFYKDDQPPVISASFAKVIKGDPGETISLNGTFYDDISKLKTSYSYRFFNDPTNRNAWGAYRSSGTGANDAKFIPEAGDTTGRRAGWSIPIPANLADGLWYLEVRIEDDLGNIVADNAPVDKLFAFTIDRAAPLVSPVDFMLGTLPGTYASATANTSGDYAANSRYFESSTDNNPQERGLRVGSVVFINGAYRNVLWIGNNGSPAAMRYRIKVSTGLTGTGATTVYPTTAAAAITAQTVTLRMDESERVFSAITPTPLDTEVFTLRGLVYERNLAELSATVNPGAGTPILFELKELDTGWTNQAVPYSAGTKTTPPATTAATAQFTIARATADDRETHVSQPAGTTSLYTQSTNDLAHLYVWTLVINRGDLAALIAQNGADGARRSITVEAKDVAQRRSDKDNWRFFLDKTSPKITFLNATWNAAGNYTRTAFETLNLQGTVEDDTFVKSLKFTIAKYVMPPNTADGETPDYAAGGYYYYNKADKAWTNSVRSADYADASWIELLPANTTGKTVGWALTSTTLAANTAYYDGNPLTGEGRYRVDFRFTDTSLSATEPTAGNPGFQSIEFYIDKGGPVIKWETEPKNFYKLNTADLTFKLTANDINSIQPAISAVVRPYGTTTGGFNVSVNQTDVPKVTVKVTAGSPPVRTESNAQNAFTVGPLPINTPSGANPPNGLVNGGRYTLVLTVKDGAGNESVTGNTIDFMVDNTGPAITVTPAPPTTVTPISGNAIVGQVEFQGTFTKPAGLSPVKLVAFALGGALASHQTDDQSETALKDAGWIFSSMGGVMETGGTKLMDIDTGLATAKMLMFDTRNLPASLMTAVDQTLPSALRFDGEALPSGAKGHTLPIHFLAIDEAGNVEKTTYIYYIYPEGDIPRVTAINNPNPAAIEVERRMNGRIRISGTAVDNVAVKYVWFRVLDGEGNPLTMTDIPEWDEATWEAKSTYQTSRSLTPYGGTATPGWYMANGGGSKSVAWWAYINSDGKLDPVLPNTERKITIEVIAEDTRRNDVGGFETGYGNGMITRAANARSVVASVVLGAPRFGAEWVKSGSSLDAAPNPNSTITVNAANGWSDVSAANLRKKAAYALTVQHELGIGAVNWNQGATTVNLMASADGGSLPGITVKVIPKNLISANIPAIAAGTQVNNRTYIIWKPGTSVPTVTLDGGGTLKDNAQYTKFTAAIGSAITLNGATLLPMTAEGVFEWMVIADLDTDLLDGGTWKNDANWYELKLSASEVSKAVPLTTMYTARIPIDNLPPEGMYTHSTNVVGSAPTFGGEAGDRDGNVKGLSRVVMWFSRTIGTTDTSVVWNELTGAGTFSEDTTTDRTSIKNYGKIPDTVKLPNTYMTGTVTPNSNRSSIVIDRHDPKGMQQHHGHQHAMGFAPGGNLGTNWYVILDSTLMTSGRTTAHFLVYDKAGNATYYSQKLMILNNIPRIKTITLGTDIRGDLGLQNTLGVSGGNVSIPNYGTGIPQSALQRIRNRFTGAGAEDILKEQVAGLSGDALDTAVGIRSVTVNTTTIGDYNVVYDERFNVRNNLLTIGVEIDNPMNAKSRHYRVDYVTNATRRTGLNFYSTITAGKVYMIDNPGTGFPWALFGAVGEASNYKRGFVFLATESAENVTGLDPLVTYGGAAVWELTLATSNNQLVPPVQYPSNTATTNPTPATGSPGKAAEFVYGNNAFTGGAAIPDFTPILAGDGRPLPYLQTGAASPWLTHSLFVVRVFDSEPVGAGRDINPDPSIDDQLFGDFALLSIQVNNNDKTPPFAQLYDLNPKAEEQAAMAGALDPQYMGDNRLRGGLWARTDESNAIVKSGHAEPRTTTSLTGPQMGGAANDRQASVYRPEAVTGAYFSVDTVSGEVILRGYVEDDQRVGKVELQFGIGAATNATTANTVTILEYNNSGTTAGPLMKAAANDNTQKTAAGDRVSFTETINLDRHRVEWAYLWDSQLMPANTIVGDVNVMVKAYTYNTATPAANGLASTDRTRDNAGNNTFDYYNPDFPAYTGTGATANFRRYNRIPMNLRPYITGFVRNKTESYQDVRSLQGRYMLTRGEQFVLAGFNLGTGAPTLTLPTATATVNATVVTTANGGTNGVLTTAGQTAFALPNINAYNYRIFSVPATAASGTGIVSYTNGSAAVNARTIPNRTGVNRAIQPWNTERSPGIEGSDLWDDFTAVHIWQSNDYAGADNNNGYFRSQGDNWPIMSPAMAVQPRTGVLHASHNENGSGTGDGNRGALMASTNSGTTAVVGPLIQFIDPIISSDIYHSPGVTGGLSAERWTVTSVIGQAGAWSNWGHHGGVYINGAGGATINGDNLTSPNNSGYYVESNWYNASSNSGTQATNPRTTEQFLNPHIVTSYNTGGTAEYIHVSYYDSKDGSIKYKSNTRGTAGTVANWIDATNPAKTWVNLDGGFDFDDIFTNNGTTAVFASTAAPGSNADNRYLRAVNVTNGQLVAANSPSVYTFGPAGITTTGNTTNVNGPNTAGYISLTYPQALTSGSNYTVNAPLRANGTGTQNAVVMTVFPEANYNTTRVVNYTGRKVQGTGNGNILARGDNINAGEHNAIAVTSQGYPVIAYYDATNQKLKMAISNSLTPTLATNWTIQDNIIPAANSSHKGTGQYVSMAIDTQAGATQNTVHIAAMNTNGNLVYVKGQISGTAFTFTAVQVVDSVGTVGRWCKISLDSAGNPWIAYQDDGKLGSTQGAKIAYYATANTKALNDPYGTSIAGWETMHIPAQFRVENPIVSAREIGRIGMECFPMRNVAANNGVNQFWGAAVSYYSTYPQTRYRIAYYVK